VQHGGAASLGSSSVTSHVWQQHEQKEDNQVHHHDAKETLHQLSLEYDEQVVGAGFLGVASKLERSTNSLFPLHDIK
jgi:hypothetical protein